MMKIIPLIFALSMLTSSTVASAMSTDDENEAETAPKPQTRNNQPDISGDGINNAFQVEDPADIGRTGSVPEDAPEPLPVEGGAGHNAK